MRVLEGLLSILFLFLVLALFSASTFAGTHDIETVSSEYTGTDAGQQIYIYADSDNWPDVNNFELRTEASRASMYVDHLASSGDVCEIYYREEDRYSRSSINLGFLPGVDELDTDGVTLRSYSPGTVLRRNQQTFRHTTGFEFEEQDHRSADEGLVGEATTDYNAYGLFNEMSDDRHQDGTGLSGGEVSNPVERSLRVNDGASGKNELYGDLLCINSNVGVDRAQWHLCPRDTPITREAEDGTQWECLDSGVWVREDQFEFEGLGSPHRGGMFQAPENTIQAFENTRLIGLQSAEFDIRVTNDNDFIVHHDTTGERRTHSQDTPLSGAISRMDSEDLVGIQARAEYAEGYSGGYCDGEPCMSDWHGWEYTVGSQDVDFSDAEHNLSAHHRYAYIPSLDETLDYFNRHNMVPRIDLKGPTRDDPDTALQVYEMVEERDMVESSIFFSLPSDCGTGLFGLGSFSCEWEGLEAIEQASGGDAVTSASYRGDIDNLWDALEEADDADMDIIDTSLEFEGWCEASNFVEEVHDRGMGFAGVRGPQLDDYDGNDNNPQKRMEVILNGVYTSADTPEWLRDRIQEVNDRNADELHMPDCLPPREPAVSAEIASDLKEAAGDFEPATEDDYLPYLTGNVTYNIPDRAFGQNPGEITKVEDVFG